MSEVLRNVQSVAHFEAILAQNPGIVFFKIGASWCPPCRAVAPLVHGWFARISDRMKAVEVDVDASPEFYAFLKRKRTVKGIPAILCYRAENTSHVPDDMVMGASKFEIDAFFTRCAKLL